jgi:pathogenesis-related protein 1
MRSNPLSQALIAELVAAHNQARSGPLDPTPSPALPPVSWDAVLADVAFNYASRCQGSGGLLNHNDNRTSDYQALGGRDYVGENIYGSTSTNVRPADAVGSWMSEAPDYNYAANNIGDAGHYTQIVWRASVRIGCAIVDCPSLRFRGTLICDYAPGGNITNQKPY